MPHLGNIGVIFEPAAPVSIPTQHQLSKRAADPTVFIEHCEIPRIWYSDQGVIAGVCKGTNDEPVARLVRVHLVSTGELIAETTSDATTGVFSVRVDYPSTECLVTMVPNTSDQRNAPRHVRVVSGPKA